MYKELRNEERFLIIFIENDSMLFNVEIDVNDDFNWKKILKYKDKIVKIETTEWKWIISDNIVLLQ